MSFSLAETHDVASVAIWKQWSSWGVVLGGRLLQRKQTVQGGLYICESEPIAVTSAGPGKRPVALSCCPCPHLQEFSHCPAGGLDLRRATSLRSLTRSLRPCGSAQFCKDQSVRWGSEGLWSSDPFCSCASPQPVHLLTYVCICVCVLTHVHQCPVRRVG